MQLITDTQLAAAIAAVDNAIAEWTYDYFTQQRYGMLNWPTRMGKLKLLRHVVESWDNRQGATNAVTQQQLLLILSYISTISGTPPSLQATDCDEITTYTYILS